MLPLMDREIPVIADTYVDREFGTGVVKITPAHDPNDFEVGKRHNLPEIDVMTNDAPHERRRRQICRARPLRGARAHRRAISKRWACSKASKTSRTPSAFATAANPKSSRAFPRSGS